MIQSKLVDYLCLHEAPTQQNDALHHTQLLKVEIPAKKEKKKKGENYPTIMHYFNMLKAKVQIHI